MTFTRLGSLSLALLLSVAFVGCSSAPAGPQLAPVKGTVNLDGKPMASGELIFLVPGKQPSIIAVEKGEFTGNAEVGDNRVEVYSYKASGNVVEMGGQKFGGEKENFIPAKYNSNTSFKAQVAAGGTSDLKFDVTSK